MYKCGMRAQEAREHVMIQVPADMTFAHFQTKVGPKKTAAAFRTDLEKSFSLLGLEYIDLFSFHGLVNENTNRHVGFHDVFLLSEQRFSHQLDTGQW